MTAGAGSLTFREPAGHDGRRLANDNRVGDGRLVSPQPSTVPGLVELPELHPGVVQIDAVKSHVVSNAEILKPADIVAARAVGKRYRELNVVIGIDDKHSI